MSGCGCGAMFVAIACPDLLKSTCISIYSLIGWSLVL